MYFCAICPQDEPCGNGREKSYPNGCPCLDEEITQASRAAYQGEDERLMLAAAQTECEGYCKQTRIEEIMHFARKMGYERIGIAHCVGLKKEAGIFMRVLRAHGFTVDAVGCKAGTIPKVDVGLRDYRISDDEGETLCNPIAQAKFLEKAGCQLAVVMGLCVGHDTLFLRHCSLPTTYLVVKDRVLGHNPVQALYLSHSYYKNKLFPKGTKEAP